MSGREGAGLYPRLLLSATCWLLSLKPGCPGSRVSSLPPGAPAPSRAEPSRRDSLVLLMGRCEKVAVKNGYRTFSHLASHGTKREDSPESPGPAASQLAALFSRSRVLYGTARVRSQGLLCSALYICNARKV